MLLTRSLSLSRRARVSSLLIAAVGGLTGWGTSSASADLVAGGPPIPSDAPDAALRREALASHDGVDGVEADRRISIQDRFVDVDRDVASLVGDQAYAGAYFSATDGRLKVTVKGAAGRTAIERHFAGIADVDVVPAEHSIGELNTALATLNSSLPAAELGRTLLTGIDASRNGLVAYVDATTTSKVPASVGVGSGSRVDVTVIPVPRDAARVRLTACAFPYCSRPLRGGIAIHSDYASGSTCSAGFTATGYGLKWLLTAGHCWWGPWYTFDNDDSTAYQLGNVGTPRFNSAPGDAERVNFSGSHWDTASGRVSGYESWTTPSFLNVTGREYSTQGSTVCRHGERSGTRCGTVGLHGVTAGTVTGLTQVDGACALPGDSGGSVTRNHVAVGMTTNSNWQGTDANPTCNATPFILFMEVTVAETLLGVTVETSP